jgi:hypothetical protein
MPVVSGLPRTSAVYWPGGRVTTNADSRSIARFQAGSLDFHLLAPFPFVILFHNHTILVP